MTNFTNFKKKSAQDMQDDIFRRMPAKKKIKMVSDLFELAKELNPRYFKQYGTEKVAHRYSQNIKQS